MDFIRYAERAAALVNADLPDEEALRDHLADRSWLHRSLVAGDVQSVQRFQADLRPVFEASGVYVFNSLTSFKDRHLRFLVAQEGSANVFQAVGFDMAEHYDRLAGGDPFKMVFTIEENTFNGTTSIQLRIKDIKFI